MADETEHVPWSVNASAESAHSYLDLGRATALENANGAPVSRLEDRPPSGVDVIVPVTTLRNPWWVQLLSHELGGPVAILRGYSSLWIDGCLGGELIGLSALAHETWLDANSLASCLNELLVAGRSMPDLPDTILAAAVGRFVSRSRPVVRELLSTLERWLHDERSAVQGNGILSVQICHTKTLMLAGLIDQLSLAVGLVAGAPNEWHVIDVPTWLRHLSHEIAGALTATGHRLLVEANGDPADALVNPGLLQAAVLNLLDNAQKHSPVGAPIVLSTTCASEWVMVQVSDRGPGLPAGLVPTLFSRIDNPFAFDLPGLGLGLTIAANVAQTLGGELRHARRQGGGCVFIIVLPRRSSHVRR